jgi:spore maturation protein CgeB
MKALPPICATKINMCCLRKLNRDLQTDRTMEIPACAAFMLGERPHEHQRLFKEGLEAEFFAKDQEMLAKVTYYLSHEAERTAVARAARQRCLASKYSRQDRLREMLDAVANLQKEAKR